jgi:hypothetical protein
VSDFNQQFRKIVEESYMDIWKLIIELYDSDKVAFIALVISLITGFFTFFSNRKKQKEDDARQELQDAFNKEAQEKLSNFQEFQKEFSIYKQSIDELQFNLQNRSDLIPYFHLNRTKSRIFSVKNQLIVEIYLTNVGRGTATNIMTCELCKDSNKIPIYFKQSPFLGKATHSFYDYFSENFAIPNESISFSLSEIKQQAEQLYFLIFKIKFSDTLGREYEQEFRFGYDNCAVKGINQNSISYPPRLINDIN